MSRKLNPVELQVSEAIKNGKPLTVAKIKTLRAESQKASTLFKSLFWAGIVIFNLALWVPFPIEVDQTLLYLIAFVALVAAVVPLPALRKHQASLHLLKVNKQSLKKKTVNEAGRLYIDQVRQQDRPFINAEFALLDGSKWAGKAEPEKT